MNRKLTFEEIYNDENSRNKYIESDYSESEFDYYVSNNVYIYCKFYNGTCNDHNEKFYLLRVFGDGTMKNMSYSGGFNCAYCGREGHNFSTLFKHTLKDATRIIEHGQYDTYQNMYDNYVVEK